MANPVSTIRNLGPKMEATFKKASVTTAEEVYALGADAAYKVLLDQGDAPHFIAYYALVMGLQGRPWNDCRGAEKDALRLRFDALKAETKPAKPESEIEQFLDEIGLGKSRENPPK